MVQVPLPILEATSYQRRTAVVLGEEQPLPAGRSTVNWAAIMSMVAPCLLVGRTQHAVKVRTLAHHVFASLSCLQDKVHSMWEQGLLSYADYCQDAANRRGMRIVPEEEVARQHTQRVEAWESQGGEVVRSYLSACGGGSAVSPASPSLRRPGRNARGLVEVYNSPTTLSAAPLPPPQRHTPGLSTSVAAPAAPSHTVPCRLPVPAQRRNACHAPAHTGARIPPLGATDGGWGRGTGNCNGCGGSVTTLLHSQGHWQFEWRILAQCTSVELHAW